MKKLVLSIVLCCSGVLFAADPGKYLPEDSMGVMVLSIEKIQKIYPDFFQNNLSEIPGIPKSVQFQEAVVSVSKDGTFTGVISGGPDPLKLETAQGSSFTELAVNGKKVYRFTGKNGNVELVDMGKGIILLTENYTKLSQKKTGIPQELKEKVQLKDSLGKMMICPPRSFFPEPKQNKFVMPPFRELYLEAFESQGKTLNFSGTAEAYDEQGAAQLMLILQQFQLMAMIALNNEDPELSAELMKNVKLSLTQNKVYLKAAFTEPVLRKLQVLIKKTEKELRKQADMVK